MTKENMEVEAARYEELCTHYSGQLLTTNKCKAVRFADRLWTVTGMGGGGNSLASVELHELVLPEQYRGATGAYPFKSNGVFYKGQAVKVRGKAFVMSGRRLTVLRKAETDGVENAPGAQLELLDWREKKQEKKKNGRKVLGVRRERKHLRAPGDSSGPGPRKRGVRKTPKKKGR